MPQQSFRVEGDPGIRVGQLAIKDVGRTEAVNPAEATLEAKLQTLRDQESAVDAEIKSAEIVKAFLERLGGDGSSATEKHGTPVPLAAVLPAARAPAPAAMRARSPQASEESTEPPYVPPTFQTQGTFATEFELPSPVNLPADGREVSLVLNKQTLTVKQRILVVPRTDKAGFVTAEAERPEGVWPEGAMQLFRDGSYVGVSHWNPSASARFKLSFGRDELLRVTVDKVAENSGTTGVFDKQTQRRIADVFSLTNMHKVAVDVLVLESSPASTSDEIKVQATFDPKPGVEAWEQRQGVIAWERTVAPGETARFGVSYSIEYPKTGFVSGLR